MTHHLTGLAIGLIFTVAVAARAAPPGKPVVRLANLEIVPDHLRSYLAALREEIDTSIRVEPGVLTLYAVAVKGHPEMIRIFEIYATPAAYESHIQSAHFKKYKNYTQKMVASLTLLETEPIVLRSKTSER